MLALIGDKLFRALAKRTGYPSPDVLQRYRDLQRELKAGGEPITLFTLCRVSGVINTEEERELLERARRFVARKPKHVRQLRPGPMLNDSPAFQTQDPDADYTDELLDLLDAVPKETAPIDEPGLLGQADLSTPLDGSGRLKDTRVEPSRERDPLADVLESLEDECPEELDELELLPEPDERHETQVIEVDTILSRMSA